MHLFLLRCLSLLLSGWSWVGVRVVKQSLVSITPGERLCGGKSVRDEGVWGEGMWDEGVRDEDVRDEDVRDEGVKDEGVRDEDVRDEGVKDEGERVGVRDEEVWLCEGYLVSDSQVRPWNV